MSSPYQNPFGDQNAPPNPYASSMSYGGAQAGYYRPHRGPLIITLGIIGLAMVTVGGAIFAALPCLPIPFFALAVSIPAWIMGSKDMKALNAGELDPTGKGITMAGMIMGIVSTALAGLFTLIFGVIMIILVVFFVIAIAAGNVR